MLTFHHVCLLKRVLLFIIYMLQAEEAAWSGEGKQSRGIMSADYTS